MFITDLKENWFSYGLPLEFAECLPDVCPVCGSPMEMSEVLTGLHCSNPRCQGKIVMRIRAICQSLGILGFGESLISKFVEYYDVTNPINIFGLRPGMVVADPDDVSELVSDKIIQQIDSKRNFQLWEFVQIANIPGIQTCAKDIFGGYSKLDDVYHEIETGGVDWIQSKLGIAKDGELSVRAMQVYTNLCVFKEDLYDGIVDVNIIDKSGVKEINIYCSDQAGAGFKHKKDFYKAIEEEFGDRVSFNIVGSVNKKLNYLIWAGADGTPCRVTNKVSTVQGYQQQGYDIPIMTANQFIEHMRSIL